MSGTNPAARHVWWHLCVFSSSPSSWYGSSQGFIQSITHLFTGIFHWIIPRNSQGFQFFFQLMFSNSPVMNSHDINPIFPISLIKSHVYSYFDSHFPLVNSQFVPEKYHQCCRETHRPPVFSLPDFVECELEGFFPHGYNLSYNNHIITISTLKKSGRVVMWFFFPWRTPPSAAFAAFAMQALESMRHSSLRPGLPGNFGRMGRWDRSG